MSHALTNKIKYLGGLAFHEKSILFRLADESRGDEGKVAVSVSTLAAYAGCDERTAHRQLKRLKDLGVLIPTGSAGGRGHVQEYIIYLDKLPVQERRAPRKTKLIEFAPKKPESGSGGGNGSHGHRPPVQVPDLGPATPAPLSAEQIEARRRKLEEQRLLVAAKYPPKENK